GGGGGAGRARGVGARGSGAGAFGDSRSDGGVSRPLGIRGPNRRRPRRSGDRRLENLRDKLSGRARRQARFGGEPASRNRPRRQTFATFLVVLTPAVPAGSSSRSPRIPSDSGDTGPRSGGRDDSGTDRTSESRKRPDRREPTRRRSSSTGG